MKFVITEVIDKFGTPEYIVSDNGKQFVSKEFSGLTLNYGITHVRTAIHSLQANASERVNQTILAAIRTYLSGDHQQWDRHLSNIAVALRSSVYSTFGVTPYFALFGTNMVNHGSFYPLARKQQLLEDAEDNRCLKGTQMEILREQLRENVQRALEANEK